MGCLLHKWDEMVINDLSYKVCSKCNLIFMWTSSYESCWWKPVSRLPRTWKEVCQGKTIPQIAEEYWKKETLETEIPPYVHSKIREFGNTDEGKMVYDRIALGKFGIIVDCA